MPVLSGFDAVAVDVDGATLHAMVGGEGEPLVLLHGFPETWWCWRRVMPLLASERRVLAFDLPGIGGSRSDDGFSRRTAAARLRAATRALGHERYAVAGHDIGAMIAYAWARDFRDEVLQLIAIEALLPGFGLEALFDCSRPGQQLWHFAFNAYPDLPAKLIRGREDSYFAYFYDTQTADPTALPAEDRATYVEAYRRPGSLDAGLGYYRSIFSDACDNQEHVTPKLTLPILTVGGEASVGSMISNSWHQVADHVELLFVPDCGHFIPEEAPDFLAGEMLGFLQGE